jgi:hypothetical protein
MSPAVTKPPVEAKRWFRPSRSASDERPLRADQIQQFAAGDLSEQAGETARGQDEANVLLRPVLAGQISGHVGSEASQQTSK